MDPLVTMLLSAAATAISSLAAFIGYLFKEERKLNNALRAEMRETDKDVINLLQDVRRTLSTPISPTNSQIYEILQRIDARIETISHR